MSMYLEPTIEAFYKSLLKYAGLTENEQGDIVNINESFGDFSIDGVHFRLPYREYLKNPEGRNFFHLLNESYTMPETALFSLFKRRLVCEINIKLYTLMIKLIHVAANPTLQQRIKSTETLNMIAQIGEVDLTLEDSLATLFKASRKANGDGFLFDIHLKKNGSINDTPYAAIGKVNFHAFKEVRRSLETKDSGYKVFGSKIGKKQLLSIESLFLTVFPDITSPESFYIGTDFKGFRYLNALLLTSYQISSRINELTENLMEVKEPLLELEDGLCELGWASKLETLYGMMDQIRMIPNQNNPKLDARHRLTVNEPEVQPQSAPAQQPAYQPQPTVQQPPAQQPAYQPQPVQQPVQPAVQQPQAPAQQAPLTPEEIVRRSLQPQVYPAPGYGAPGGYPPPGYPHPHPQPMYPQPLPAHYPQPQPAFYPPQQPVYQQPMYPGYPQPQPVYQQPQPGYPQQPGMPVGHRPLDPFLSGGR